MSLIEQIEKDKLFGQEIMKAAGIKTLTEVGMDGLQLSILIWLSKGNHVGPVFAYLGNEANISIMWPYRIKEPRIFQSTLKKALPIMKKTGHTGPVTLRMLIKRDDEKTYGIRWHTSLTKEVIRHTASLLKITFSEWADWLQNRNESDEIQDIFLYKYSGFIIEQLNDVNSKLLTFRMLGYELPFNSETENLSTIREFGHPRQQ